MEKHLQKLLLLRIIRLGVSACAKVSHNIFLSILLLFAGVFNQIHAQVINNVTVTGSPFCQGSNVTVKFDVVNGVGTANYFKVSTSYQAYLFNSSGIWQALGSPFNVFLPYGSGDGVMTPNLQKIIPLPTPLPAFSGYRIAVTSTGPTSTGVIGSNGSADFTTNSPGVSIVSNDGDNNICAGTSVIFTATPVNGGATPTYQWYIDGTPVGTNSATFTTTSLVNSNQVKVVMTSSAGCVTPSTATSNIITITVNTSITPSVNITPVAVNICSGSSFTFSAGVPTNGGLSPAYQWQSSTNGGASFSDISGATASTHTTTTLVDNEIIRVKLVSSAACASPNPVYSNAVTVQVSPPPAASSAGADQNLCTTSTTLNANTPGSGSGAWSIISGAGGSISNTTNPTSGFTGVAGNTYVLRWSISNGACSPSTDEVTISFKANPTTAAAGSDQSVCGNSLTLSANTPTSGNGIWSIVSGVGGSFANSASANSVFTGTPGVTYVLRWEISNAPCVVSADDVTIILSATPSVANAGANFNVCNSAVTLAGNQPVVGTGLWTIVSGAGGIISNPSQFNSTFTGVSNTLYTLSWTISNGTCASSTDNVNVHIKGVPTPSSAGPDQTGISTCGLSIVTLAANTPTVGTGVWSIVSGAGGSFADDGNPATTFSGTPGATYVLRWTITNNPCPDSFDDLTVTFNRNPTIANAGTDQVTSATCGNTSVSLGGNIPSVGAGAWSILSGGSGTFSNASSATSTFSGTAGATYVLRWTISNSPCNTSADEVTITFNLNPTVANAGADQTASMTCGSTTATLAANNPATGTGMWAIISGSGGSFSNASNYNTSFSGTAGTTYILRWTISNSPCAISSDDVSVTFGQVPTTANAGADQVSAATCGVTSVTLNANIPSVGTGAWSIISGAGGSFGTSSSPTSSFSGTAGVTYVLRWTITSASCGTSTDDVTITLNTRPVPSFTALPSAITCVNTAYTYTTQAGQSGYVWSLTGTAGVDYTITAGSTGTTSNTVTLQWLTAGSKTVSVNYNTAAGCNGITPATFTTVVNLIVAPAVSITSSTVSICSGTSVTFTATPVNGGTAPSYQWKVNGSNVGTNSAVYTTSSLTNGQIVTVVMTSNAPCPSPATATSNPVSVAVYTSAPAGIANNSITGPSSICPPATVTYTVAAVARAESYVWILPTGFSITSGAGTNTITVSITPSAVIGNGQIITVYATNPCGSGNSRTFSVNVNNFAGINAGPDQNICIGGTATLAGVWSGNTSSSTWTAPSGTFSDASIVNPTYTPSITTGSVTLTLRTNDPSGVCTSSSDEMIISVYQPPAITVQPVASRFVCSGSSAIFSVTATGSGLTYQWRKGTANLTNGGNVAGATTATLTLSNIAVADMGTYNVVVSGIAPCPPVTSTESVLLVNEIVAISNQPVSLTRCTGGSATFSVTASGTGLTYQWYNGTSALSNGGGISGATTSTLTINPVAMAHATSDYHVVISGTAPCAPLTSASVSLTVNDAPAITVQPVASQSVCSGSTVSFSVTATGSGLTYQWRKGTTNLTNGGNISGATTATLTLSNTTVTDAGTYNVVVSGLAPCTNVTSDGSALTVNEIIAISNQPVSLTRCTGSSAVFSVTASGTGLTYQWYNGATPLSDGAGITGSATSTMTINPVAMAHTTSDYHVVISGAAPCAPLTSAIVSLTVNDAPAITAQPVASQSVCSGSTVSFSVTATGSGLTYQWRKGTTDLTNGANISGATTATLTLSNTAVTDAGTYNVVVSGLAPCTSVTSGGSALNVNEVIAISNQPVSLTVCTGSSAVFSVTASGTGLTYQWYNGSSALTNGGGISGAATSTLTISPVAMSHATSDYHVVISGTAPCAPLTSAIVSLTVNDAPAISVQPVATQSVCSGSAVSFSVTATGSGLTYQWRKGTTNLTNGANISGATTATLTLSNTTVTDAGTYNVVVSGLAPCTSVTSGGSALTVNEIIAISNQPVSLTVCTGSSAVFSVAASGTGLTYQWYNGSSALTNGGGISGATTSTLTISPVAMSHATNDYHVVISGAAPCASLTSAVASLTVNEGPVITVQPLASQATCAGSTISFSVTATGSGLSYQWRKGTTNLTNGGNISGATTSTLTIANAGAADAATDYNVVISGISPCADIVSQNATLVVNNAVVINTQPSNVGVCGSNPAMFGVVASGSGVTYQWFKGTFPGTAVVNSATITGAQSNILNFIQAVPADEGIYYVLVSGVAPCPSVRSNEVTLNIDQSITITNQPVAVTVCENATGASFTVEANAGGDALTYQWRKNGVNIPGANAAVLNLSAITLASAGNYDVVISGSPGYTCPSITSLSVALTVTPSVGVPTVINVSGGAEPLCQLTNGTTTTNYQTTASNNTGFNWSLSNPAAGAIDAATGVMTWANGFLGTVNIQVTANGCNGPSSQVIRTVVIGPTLGTPSAITVSSGAEPVCQVTNSTTSTTYATTAANNTGFNWSISNPAAGSIHATSGVMTWASGFFGTVDIQVTANGCNGPSAQAFRTVTITPTVGTPTAITVASGVEPTCQLTNGGTSTSYASTATNSTGFTWSLSNAAAGSINATSGVMTWANNFSGSVNIQVIANGCNAPSSQVVRSVVITPTVGVPSAITVAAGIQPTCQITSATPTTTFATSATNSTGYNWSLNDAAAGTIDASGLLTWSPGFSGTVNIQVTANGCNGPSVQVTRSVVITPSVGTPVFTQGSTTNRCKGAGTVSLQASATTSTGLTYTLDAASLSGGCSINATTGVVTFASSWVGISAVTATAAGCGSSSSEHTITTSSPSVGGNVAMDGARPAVKTVCPPPLSNNNGVITLDGQIGSVTGWEYSYNAGGSWNYVGTNTTTTYSFSNINQSTIFRAVVKNGACAASYSEYAVASVVPPYPPSPVVASPSTICLGQTSVLSAAVGYPINGITNGSGTFDQANLDGWCIDGQCTANSLPASGNNTGPARWQETNGPKVFQGITYDSRDNTKFAIASGAFAPNSTTILETPAFSLIGLPTAQLNFFHAFKLAAGATLTIDVSTDSGATYRTVLFQATGPTSYGITGTTAVLQSVNISLNAYLGLEDIRIRFKYVGNTGSSWAIDGIEVPNNAIALTYIWSDPSSPTTLNQTSGTTVNATPTQTTTYNIATTVAGCPGGVQPITVTVVPATSISLATLPNRCATVGSQSTTLPFNNAIGNPSKYSIVWDSLPLNNFANITDVNMPSGSFPISIPPNTAAGTYTGTVKVKNNNDCSSPGYPFSIVINPRPTAALVDTTVICQGESATFAIAVTGPGTITGSLTNGMTFSGMAPTINITVSPTATTTYNLASLTNGTCSSISADLSGAHKVVVNNPIAISAQPQTADICLHDNAVIVSAATGTIASHQWQVSTDNGVTWNDITNGTRYSGTTTGTLTVIDPTITMIDHKYRNKITSAPPCANSLTSNVTNLKIRNVWLGTVSTDWQDGANWSHGQPASVICDTTHILNRSNHPTLNAGTSYNTNLLIYPGAYLTLANQPATFIAIAASTINNGGTFNALDGRVMLNGTIQHQTLTGSTFLNRTLNYLTVANTTATGASLAGAPNADTLYISNHINFGNVNGKKFTTNSNLTLMSRASRTASVGDLTNNNTNTLNKIDGQVTVERYIPSRKAWRYLSVTTTGQQSFREYWQERNNVANANIYPAYGTTITSGTPATFASGGFDTYSLTGPSVKIYNATTNDYDGIPNVFIPMSTPRGLMTFVRGNRSATTFYDPPSSTILRHAGILKQGTQTALPVQANTFTDFGNPYASAIDMRKIDKPGVQDMFYIWDPTMYGGFGLGAWKTFTYSNGNYYPTPGGGAYGSGPQNFIESQLAFIVRGATGGSITFDETDKDLSTRMVFRGAVEPEQLRATVMIDTTVMDGVLVDYGKWSNSVDYDDAIKLRNNNENVGISRENKILSVERRMTVRKTDTVFLRFTGTRVQNYKWLIELKNMDSAGRTGYLIDNHLKTQTPLNLDGSTQYAFSVVAGVAGTYEPERFKIVFNQVRPVKFTTIAAMRNSDKTVKVNWKVEHEDDVYLYTTERSFDGNVFTGIITTASTSHIDGTAAYSVNDLGASEMSNFYRIKGIGNAGQVVTSEVVKVGELPAIVKSEISVYPNPVVDRRINIHFVNEALGNYQARMLVKDGKVAMQKSFSVKSKDEHVKMNFGYVPTGSYVLEITSPTGEKTLKNIFIH